MALVGPSGSGKSTIAQLMLRLYDPNEGSVHFGGQDIRQCEGAEVRKRCGDRSSGSFIFKTTTRKNIQVAKPDVSDAEIESACRQANAPEFIQKLGEGRDTLVGEGGLNLTAGHSASASPSLGRSSQILPSSFLARPPALSIRSASS